MGWLGKFVGGTLGFAVGGPLGAVLGATFGHAFDSGSNLNSRNSNEYISVSEQNQMTFFVAAFSMLAKLAKADGKVSPEEIKSIEKFIIEDLKLRSYSSNIAMNIFHTALISPQTFDAFALQFYRQFYTQPQMLELMIDIMLRVSIADGYISKGEEDLLLKASNIFQFDQSKYEQLKSKYINNDMNNYYAILGCTKNETAEKIKSCYRKKVQEYHPDKIAAKGLPEEFTKFAQTKFREIQEAWEQVKKEKGIR